MVHRFTYKSDLERVRKFMALARKAAWGPKLIKTDGARKVRVNIAGNPNVEGEEQQAVPGRMVEMLVQGDEVYLVSPLHVQFSIACIWGHFWLYRICTCGLTAFFPHCADPRWREAYSERGDAREAELATDLARSAGSVGDGQGRWRAARKAS